MIFLPVFLVGQGDLGPCATCFFFDVRMDSRGSLSRHHQMEVSVQWPCNRIRLIGGTDSIYLRPMFQGISPQNMALYGTSILGSWRSPIDQWVAGRTSHTMGQNRGIHMLGITHGQLGTFRPHKKNVDGRKRAPQHLWLTIW